MSDLKQYIEKEFLGIPYVFGGVDRSGFDCSGFIYYLFNDYYGVPIENMTANQYYDLSASIEDFPQEGDLVFFTQKKNNTAHHVGVMVNDYEFAHASSSKGITITPLNNSYWKPRIIGFGKLL